MRKRKVDADGLPNQRHLIRVLIADDHPVLCQGLEHVLQAEADIRIIGFAVNGEQAVKLAGELSPDVILMDGQMPIMDGLAATKRIAAEWPQVKIVGFSMHHNTTWAAAMVQAGASLCIAKTSPLPKLLAALRTCGRKHAA